MHSVREINDIAELGGLRSTWRTLLERTPGATFFSTLEWLEVYWRHFAGKQRLRILVVSDGPEIIGFLPLVVRREPRRVGAVQILTYPLDDWGSYYGPIGPDRSAILLAGLRHIGRTARDWDLIDLRYVDEAGADNGATHDAMRQAGLQTNRKVRDRVPMVRLPGCFDAYLASRTSKWRHKLKRWRRNVSRCGTLTYKRHVSAPGDADPRWDLYDACDEVARRSWQGTSTDGTTLCHDSVRGFLRDVHVAATCLGAADINLMWLSGQPVAFAYNYVWNGCVYGLRIGYDARVCRAGVGNLLCVDIVRDSIARGYHNFDMGPGSLSCKRVVQTEVREALQYTHYRWGAPRAQLLRLKQVFTRWLGASPHGPESPATAAK